MIGAVFSYGFVEVFGIALLFQDPSKLCIFYMCSPNSPHVWTLKPRVYAFAPACLRACLTSHSNALHAYLVITSFQGVTGKIVLVLLNYSALDSEQKKRCSVMHCKGFSPSAPFKIFTLSSSLCRFSDYSFYSFLLISKNNWQIDKLTKAAKLWQ